LQLFDTVNGLHRRLALSQQAHQLTATGDTTGLAAIEAQVNQAAELWGITGKELQAIRRSLEEFGQSLFRLLIRPCSVNRFFTLLC
jgi:hypothetical protein